MNPPNCAEGPNEPGVLKGPEAPLKDPGGLKGPGGPLKDPGGPLKNPGGLLKRPEGFKAPERTLEGLTVKESKTKSSPLPNGTCLFSFFEYGDKPVESVGRSPSSDLELEMCTNAKRMKTEEKNNEGCLLS